MKPMCLWIAGAALMLGCASTQAFDLQEAARMAAAMGAGNNSEAAVTPALVGALGDLQVTPQQAVGGTGALLNVARAQLPASEYSALSQAVPGLAQLEGGRGLGQFAGLAGLLGQGGAVPAAEPNTLALLDGVRTMQDAQGAFSALGMNAELIGQFAPILLQYLGNQGVGGPLLQSLAAAWSTPAR